MDLVVPFEGFTYRPHQSEAIQWMCQRENDDAPHCCGGILADEMGLGKTWSTIGLLLNRPVHQTLLIVPTALQSQWMRGLFDARIRHRVLKGGKWMYVIPPNERPNLCVSLVAYGSATHYSALLYSIPFDRIICDEGHALRNGRSIRRFDVLTNVDAPRRWILSGTPIQNSKNDMLNLLRFLKVSPETLHTIELRTLANLLMMRRVVADVRDTIELPEAKPRHIIHPVTFGSKEEAEIFSALVGRFEHAVEIQAQAFIVLELYLRIRQFIAHPSLYVQSMMKKYKDSYKRDGWTGTASKHEAFSKLVKDLDKEPTIVFGTFTAELMYAEQALINAGYKTYVLAGSLTDAKRDYYVKQSRCDAEAGIPIAVVVQIMSGGAGLNLQHCNRVFFLSSHWNPAVVDQAVARAYRMGQTRPVTVHHLLLADDAEKNLDRYMARMHGEKRSIALQIHDKLYCTSAMDVDNTMDALDAYVDAE